MPRTYQREAEQARKLIAKNGDTVVFYKTGGTVQDDVTGEEATLPDVEAAGVGLLLNYNPSLIGNSQIEARDAYVLYSGEKPDSNMSLDHSGRTWSIKNIETLQPTTTAILYKVQVQ